MAVPACAAISCHPGWKRGCLIRRDGRHKGQPWRAGSRPERCRPDDSTLVNPRYASPGGMTDIALPRRGKSRALRGLALVLSAAILILGAAFASTHLVGAVHYLPKLNRLFAELHRDPV